MQRTLSVFSGEMMNVDRSDWKARVATGVPASVHFLSRIDSFVRLARFLDVYRPGKTRVKEELKRAQIVPLLLQHFRCYGLQETSVVLREESGVEDVPNLDSNESLLLNYLRVCIRDVETLYDYAIDDGNDTDLNDVEELLVDLELLNLIDGDMDGDNVNIWLDTRDDSIVFADGGNLGNIKAATFNKLVEKLTAEADHDMGFQKTFLMTYQSFASPEQLMSKLIERFHIPPELDMNPTRALKIKLRVGNVIKKWVESYTTDFDRKLQRMLKEFLGELSGETDKTISALRESIAKSTSKSLAKTDGDNLLVRQFRTQPLEPKVNMKLIFSPELKWIDIDSEELARQLTLMDFGVYSAIRPTELLNQAWAKPQLKHRAPNVTKMSIRFNHLSYWVATQIVKEVRLKDRAKVMTKFIRIAEHLDQLNNFQGVQMILSALGQSSVYRLNLTAQELPNPTQQMLDGLRFQMSSAGSFSAYRARLSTVNPPCIPYLGVHLTDLTFLDENPDMIQGLINFGKRTLIFSNISKVQQFQQPSYNLLHIAQIQSMLKKVTYLEEKELYRLSLLREPRKMDRTQILEMEAKESS